MKRLFNLLSQRGLLPLVAVFLCLIGSTGNAWASSKTYYAKLTANGEAGKGYVYASSTNNDAAATELASATTKTSTQTSGSSSTQNHYAWAFPARAYKFSGWTGSTSPKATVKANTGISDNIQITGGTTSNGTVGTATASWTALTPYTITYLTPENGAYNVQYSYYDNKSGNSGLQANNPSYDMTKDVADKAVTSYERDEIVLSTALSSFLGWYESNAAGDEIKLLSEESEFTYKNNTTGHKVDANVYIKAKFKAPSEYQASVTISGVTTNYKTWAEALAAANASSANPTITLLDNVLDLTASQSITKSMTLDLNDYSITGNVTKLININGEGITVTIRDNGAKGMGTISMIGSGNAHLYGVYITKGTLNFENGTIHAENTTTYASGSSERASAVYVTNPYTFNMTGGRIEAVSDYYAYGVNIAAGSATSHGKANISGGVIESTSATKVRGILNYGDLTITGGEVIANTTTSTEAVGIYMDGANKAVANIKGGTITATAFTTTSYGVYVNNASDTVSVSGGTILAKTAGSTTAYGIFHNAAATTTVSGGTITGNPKTDTGYGIYSKGGTVNVTGGTIFGNATGKTSVGIYASAGTVNVEGGVVKSAAPTSTSYALQQASSSVFNVTGGKFYTTSAATLANAAAATAANMKISGGFFNLLTNIDNYLIDNNKTWALTDGTEYDEGYRYAIAVERPLGVSVCKVIANKTSTNFYTLENALTYAQQNSGTSMTIIMLCNYTLPAGYYTVPSNVSLVVPYKADQTAVLTTNGKASHNQTYTTPSLFRKLTLDEGAHLEVFGVLETSCQMFNNSQGNKGNGNPTGPYGQIDMAEGSTITMVAGSKLYAWGYITGKGMVDARRGSQVYEMFQVYDWKGGTASKNMNNNTEKIFLVNQYYIQNIEVPIKFHPGSHEYTSFGVVMSSTEASSDNIGIIGLRNKKDGTKDDVAMFLMDEYDDSEDTWVMKDYDEINDRQIYSINSAAKLSSIDISVSVTLISVKMNSANYILPITNNMSIHLLSGAMGITQDVALLPGAEIEVDKEATASIDANKTLYLYDSDQWGPYAYSSGFSNPVLYSPSWKKCPRITSSAAALGDAKLNIHGTLEVNGALRTTANGANIFSSVDDAGTIIFKTAAPTTAVQLYQMEGTATKRNCDAIPALLTNENNSYPTTATSGTTAGKSFCYLDVDGNGGKWTSLTTDRCFAVDEANDIIYAKPGAYVAITSKTEDANHLYHSVVGDRLFIVIHGTNHIGCQWWEVKQTEEDDTVYYCADNDTYYYYDGAKWAVKKIEVTWTNFDGTKIEVYNVPFGGKPKFLGTNPKRTMDSYYTYSFVGWLPEITEETKLFENTTYVAQYERHDRLFAISFKDGSKTLEIDYYSWGSMPVCEKLPTKEGYILSWNPALGAVSGDQVYTAVWTAETVDPTTLSYTVTWKNYQGTTLETDTEVPYGATPSYDGATPTKAAIKDIAFVHDGWTPDVVPVTGNVTYTATFRETPALYTVTFKAQDGTTIETQQVAYGEVPVCQNMPTQPSTVEFYYVAKWDKQITAVIGDVTYTHKGFTAYKNTCRLTVAAGANGTVKLAGASDPLSAIYDYGTNVTISATANAHYHFVQWSDGNTENPRTVTVTETKTLTAQFAIDQVTITWLNYDGVTIATSEVDYGATPAYKGATPNRPAGCGVFYTFNGWSPAFAAVTTATSYTAQYNEDLQPSLISYQVAFAANGGTGTMTNQSFTYGVAQSLKSNTFKHTPYTITYVYDNGDANNTVETSKTFLNWKNGSTTYTDGQSVKNLTNICDGVVTLTAQWNNSVTPITLPTPSKSGHTFAGWYDAKIGGNKVGVAGASYTPSANITLYAHWEANNSTIDTDVTLPTGVTEEGTYTITSTGSVTVPAGATLRANTLVLEATEDNSGEFASSQLINNGNIQTTNAYFDLKLDIVGRQWYAVAVPWQVDATTGIELKGIKTLSLGVDEDVVYYDGAVRAAKGKDADCIKYLEDLGDKTMYPGKMYFMYFANSYNNATIRFTKKSGTDLLFNGTIPVALHSASNDADANWNGLANPTTYKAILNAGTTYGFTYNAETQAYQKQTLSSTTFVVGRPVMVQAENAINLGITRSVPTPVAARSMAAQEPEAEIVLSENGITRDQVTVKVIEDKEDSYIIGTDLAKPGVSSRVAQMWINRYNANLAVNATAPAADGTCDYPLTLKAPKAGEYDLQITNATNDMELYLTYEDQIIWNLSMSDYTISLAKGTTTGYGLRIVPAQAPGVTTSIDNTHAETNNQVQKVIINGALYILREGKAYDAQGKQVKL